MYHKYLSKRTSQPSLEKCTKTFAQNTKSYQSSRPIPDTPNSSECLTKRVIRKRRSDFRVILNLILSRAANKPTVYIFLSRIKYIPNVNIEMDVKENNNNLSFCVDSYIVVSSLRILFRLLKLKRNKFCTKRNSNSAERSVFTEN